MDIARIAQTRRTCKAYDPTRKIPDAQIAQLKTLLRYAPSSVNSQPWHFIVAASDAGKAQIMKATPEGSPYAANAARIRNASHVVVLCARTDLEDAQLARLLEQETADGRFPTPESRDMQRNARGFYVSRHRSEPGALATWTQKQVYLALGMLLLGAATLEIDATPIEGFDAQLLDEALGLPEKGLHSVVMAALGYRGADDFNATLPKSRLPEELTLSDI